MCHQFFLNFEPSPIKDGDVIYGRPLISFKLVQPGNVRQQVNIDLSLSLCPTTFVQLCTVLMLLLVKQQQYLMIFSHWDRIIYELEIPRCYISFNFTNFFFLLFSGKTISNFIQQQSKVQSSRLESRIIFNPRLTILVCPKLFFCKHLSG